MALHANNGVRINKFDIYRPPTIIFRNWHYRLSDYNEKFEYTGKLNGLQDHKHRTFVLSNINKEETQDSMAKFAVKYLPTLDFGG